MVNPGRKKVLFFLFGLILFLVVSRARPPARVPGADWQQYASPEEAGFSSGKLERARRYYERIDSAALVVVYRGVVLAAWGDYQRRYMCHSVRKSFMSAIYGIYVEKGAIDAGKTLKQLRIDDKPPLSEKEKQARVIDLLKARSGVYHRAAGETASMKRMRPKRGSHAPGAFWYYNNWDFNALSTIFRQETGEDFFQAFKKCIAVPLQMEDFRLADAYYHYEHRHSIHPAYSFKMSARDMARFGLLFLLKGMWNGKRLLPLKWVIESTRKHSATGWQRGDYGYMWWVSRNPRFKKLGMFSAYGVGGQRIHVLPGADMVFVHRVDTYNRKRVKDPQINRLLTMILDARAAKPEDSPALAPLPDRKAPIQTIKPGSGVLNRYVHGYRLDSGFRAFITKEGGNLWIYFPEIGRFRLLPVSRTHFIMEDFECPVYFKLDKAGNPTVVSIHFSKKNIETGSPQPADPL